MTDELKKADEIVRALRCDDVPNEYDNLVCTNEKCKYHGTHGTCDDAPMHMDAADLIDSLTAQLADYHHMSKLVDGKMAENQRLRKINEKLQSKLVESQRREKAAVEELAAHAYAHAASCKHYADCYKVAYAKCAVIRCASCDKYDFCGPQEAEKGTTE